MVSYESMKKALLAGVLALSLPLSVFAASFDVNLHYGSKGDDVVALQEFLSDQGCFKGTATGNFYSLTLAAVKCFQKAEGITPVSGYVGPITRGVINTVLAEAAPDSEGDATTTAPIVNFSQTPTPAPPPSGGSSGSNGAPVPPAAPVVVLPAPHFSQAPVSTFLGNNQYQFTWQSDISATAEWGPCSRLTGGGASGIPRGGEECSTQQTQTGTSGVFAADIGATFYFVRLTANGQQASAYGQMSQSTTSPASSTISQ